MTSGAPVPQAESEPNDEAQQSAPLEQFDELEHSPAASAAVLIDATDDRVVVTLNRPAVRNAIDDEIIEALHAVCAELEAEPRILILTGAGGDFSAGADIARLVQRRAADARAGINTNTFLRIHALELPVIAAIDGYAL